MCRCCRADVTWSRGPGRAAAFCTSYSGAIVGLDYMTSSYLATSFGDCIKPASSFDCQSSSSTDRTCRSQAIRCLLSTTRNSSRPSHIKNAGFRRLLTAQYWCMLPVAFLPGRPIFWPLCPTFRRNPGLAPPVVLFLVLLRAGCT